MIRVKNFNKFITLLNQHCPRDFEMGHRDAIQFRVFGITDTTITWDYLDGDAKQSGIFKPFAGNIERFEGLNFDSIFLLEEEDGLDCYDRLWRAFNV